MLSNFMMQGNFNRLDIGVQYVFDDQISLGITGSSSTLNKAENSSLITSVTTFLGARWQGFRYGYSYDFNTTNLMNIGGIHEFSISYDFNINIRKLGVRMNLTEIKNMDKWALLEFLDLYEVEAYPDEYKRKLRMKAIDLFWRMKENTGYGYETVASL